MSESIVPPRRARVRRIALLLPALVLALGLTIVASTQQPADAARADMHLCHVIGTLPNSNQAVVCSDIEVAPVSGGVEIWGAGEYYCQGPDLQCKGIHADNTMFFLTTNAIPPFTGTFQNRPYECSTTGCPNGPTPNNRAIVSTPHRFIITGECDIVTATVSTGAAVLVNGTSTAFHPQSSVSVTDTICGNSIII
jgi:hypothetical protein